MGTKKKLDTKKDNIEAKELTPADFGRTRDDSQNKKTRSEPNSGQAKTPRSKEAEASKETPLGQLSEIRRKVFQSTAGLLYIPGSADGHRFDHVMEHAEDDPTKKVHGVFDGDRNTILATIDEAYLLAQKGGRNVQSKQQNDRQVHTVKLSRRIGYVCGEDGKRQRNPECRYLRLVLEEHGDEKIVISAFPTKSF